MDDNPLEFIAAILFWLLVVVVALLLAGVFAITRMLRLDFWNR